MIEYDYTELTALSRRVQEAGTTVARITLNEGLRKLGKIFVPTTGTGPLADATPRVSGKLKRSTVFQIIGGAMRQALEIRQAAKSPEGVYYGYIVREGRGPVHAINAKALHFFIGDQEFFRKSVGPALPNPYHRRVLQRLMPQVQKVVDDMGEKIGAYIIGTGTT
ncbi:hypothetical protein ES703_63729 [subsurface metagenome]